MLYGIKYEHNRAGRNKANEMLQKLGSAFYICGTCEFYLDNLYSALIVAKGLNKSHDTIKYKVFKLTKEEETIVQKEKVASSAEEFRNLVAQRNAKEREKLQQMVEELQK